MSKHDTAKLGQEMVMLGTYEDYDLDDILAVLKAADDLYYNDQLSFLEDNEYDALRKYAERLEPHHPYFTGVGSAVRGGKVKLPTQLGSLDQVYEGEITDWVGNWNLQKQYIILTDKLDGISALLVYDDYGKLIRAYSRGNGIEGQLLTSHINNIKSIPKHVSSKIKHVRGELIISKDNWKKMHQVVKKSDGTQYKNSRNCIAGLMNTINQHPSCVYDLIDFVAYEIKDYYEENT